VNEIEQIFVSTSCELAKMVVEMQKRGAKMTDSVTQSFATLS
jgi:hypothetical protein